MRLIFLRLKRLKSFSEKMSVCFRSVSNKIKYLLNFKSASLRSTSTKPKPPEIQSDSLLISWGLLSGKYNNTSTQNIISTKLSSFHQLFVVIFFWLNLIKFMSGLYIDDSSDCLYLMGDVSVVFQPTMKRIFIQIFYITSTLKASIITTYFSYYHNFKQGMNKFSWLHVLQLTKGLKSWKFLFYFF